MPKRAPGSSTQAAPATDWPALMSLSTIASYLQVSKRTAEKWRTLGTFGPPVKLPNAERLVRFQRAAIDKVVAEWAATPPATTRKTTDGNHH